jgi:hypothetical protein|tara:strand:+ start:2158 stop:3204 length:1047 start_codon:yes stop_codon:yes gene_type:complete
MTDFKRPIPQRQNELLRKNLSAPSYDLPSLADKSKNGSDFAKNSSKLEETEFPIRGLVPDNKPPGLLKDKVNRSNVIRRDDDDVKDVSIGLQDHDESIAYYFDKVIQPSVVKQGVKVKVPLIYGNPERWKGVQQDGYYRDKEGKIQTPLIMFKRTSIEKRRDLGNKMDANNPQLQHTVQKTYSKRNQYDNFSILQGRIPQKEIYNVVIPDYVKLKYTFTIWTSFIADMNKITEAINYASDSYWGDPERFKFNARIDSFTNKVEIAQGSNRVIKTEFDMVLQGYIIPEAMGALLKQHPKKTFSKSVSTFFTETTGEADIQRDRARHKINKVGDEGKGIGYDTIGKQQIG